MSAAPNKPRVNNMFLDGCISGTDEGRLALQTRAAVCRKEKEVPIK